jgi:hypothetical protein
MLKGNEYTLPMRYGREDYLEFFLCEGVHEKSRLRTLTEDKKDFQANEIIRAMLGSISERIELIDLRFIDKSKGDITRVKDYKSIKDAINQLMNFVQSNTGTDSFYVVSSLKMLSENLERNDKLFKKFYSEDNNIGIWMYQSMVLNLFYGTMLAVSNIIDLIKTNSGYQVMTNTKSRLRDKYVFVSITRFNSLINDGKLSIYAKEPTFSNESGTILASLAFGVLATFIIVFAVREAVIFFFDVRNKISRHMKIVSQFLEINASSLKDKKVSKNQEKLAKDLLNLADQVNVSNDMAENAAKIEVRQEINTEYKGTGLEPPEDVKVSSSLL